MQSSCVSLSWLVEASVRHFAVVVFLSRVAESPTSCTKLQDLQQEQATHGAQVLLQEKPIPQQIEQLIHQLHVHLLQLISNTMQLQHQTVHLREAEMTYRQNFNIWVRPNIAKNKQKNDGEPIINSGIWTIK